VTPVAPQRDPVRSRRLPFTLGLITMVLSLCSGLATYAILTGLTPIVPTHLVVVGVLLINLVLVLAMLGIIAWQVGALWLARPARSFMPVSSVCSA
jgi:two-component system, NtrC family, nitrogen regulation sensor histidine kinase NtrY